MSLDQADRAGAERVDTAPRQGDSNRRPGRVIVDAHGPTAGRRDADPPSGDIRRDLHAPAVRIGRRDGATGVVVVPRLMRGALLPRHVAAAPVVGKPHGVSARDLDGQDVPRVVEAEPAFAPFWGGVGKHSSFRIPGELPYRSAAHDALATAASDAQRGRGGVHLRDRVEPDGPAGGGRPGGRGEPLDARQEWIDRHARPRRRAVGPLDGPCPVRPDGLRRGARATTRAGPPATATGESRLRVDRRFAAGSRDRDAGLRPVDGAGKERRRAGRVRPANEPSVGVVLEAVPAAAWIDETRQEPAGRIRELESTADRIGQTGQGSAGRELDGSPPAIRPDDRGGGPGPIPLDPGQPFADHGNEVAAVVFEASMRHARDAIEGRDVAIVGVEDEDLAAVGRWDARPGSEGQHGIKVEVRAALAVPHPERRPRSVQRVLDVDGPATEPFAHRIPRADRNARLTPLGARRLRPLPTRRCADPDERNLAWCGGGTIRRKAVPSELLDQVRPRRERPRDHLPRDMDFEQDLRRAGVHGGAGQGDRQALRGGSAGRTIAAVVEGVGGAQQRHRLVQDLALDADDGIERHSHRSASGAVVIAAVAVRPGTAAIPAAIAAAAEHPAEQATRHADADRRRRGAARRRPAVKKGAAIVGEDGCRRDEQPGQGDHHRDQRSTPASAPVSDDRPESAHPRIPWAVSPPSGGSGITLGVLTGWVS